MDIHVFGVETKKMLNILILDILRKFSDKNHHLTQQEIIRKLKTEHNVEKIDRRTVRANVQSLVDMGYSIKNEGEHGYYMYKREFDDAELRILIDSVLFSKNISDTEAKALIKKLKSLGNVYFNAKVSNVRNNSTFHRTDNKNILSNINIINEAIGQNKKITFRYIRYGTDFKMHDQCKDYVVSPYWLVLSNEYYYLIGNTDKYDDISHYRIDKMARIKILDEKIRPKNEVKGMGDYFDLPKHMSQHIYMMYGNTVVAKIKVKSSMMDTLVDCFGKTFIIVEKNNEDIVFSIRCNEMSLFSWALQYGPSVEVLEPQSLRDKVAEAVDEMVKKYRGS